MSKDKLNKTSYVFAGDYALKIILDFIDIRIKYGENYLEYFNESKSEFDKLLISPISIEFLKHLLKSDFKINNITKNTTLKLIDNKFTIIY